MTIPLINKRIPRYTGEKPNKIEQGNGIAFFQAIDALNAFSADLPDHMNDMADEENSMIEQMNLVQPAADAALAASNFKGNWDDLSGPVAIPASMYKAVTDTTGFWVLTESVSDITAEIPGVSLKLVEIPWKLFRDPNPTLANDLKGNGKSGVTIGADQAADASVGSGTHTLDYSTSSAQKVTATGDFTIAFSNFIASKLCRYTLYAVDFGAHTVTFPVGILLEEGEALDFTASGMDEVEISKNKDGTYSVVIAKTDMRSS